LVRHAVMRNLSIPYEMLSYDMRLFDIVDMLTCIKTKYRMKICYNPWRHMIIYDIIATDDDNYHGIALYVMFTCLSLSYLNLTRKTTDWIRWLIKVRTGFHGWSWPRLNSMDSGSEFDGWSGFLVNSMDFGSEFDGDSRSGRKS